MSNVSNNQQEFVCTGFFAVASEKGVLRSSPLGSCIAVAAYDKTTKNGGLAHIMLPGKSLTNDTEDENKYAENAITNLLEELYNLGSLKANIEICLVGGADVLNRNDTLIPKITTSVLDIMKSNDLMIKATSLGGNERRSATIDLSSGIVYYTVGDGMREELYSFGE